MKRKLLWALLIATLLTIGCNRTNAGTPQSPSDDLDQSNENSGTSLSPSGNSSRNTAENTDDEPDSTIEWDTETDAANLPTLVGSYQGFLDQDTVEFEIDGNLITFQVYDPDIALLLSEMNTGEEATLTVEVDEETEARTIKSLIPK